MSDPRPTGPRLTEAQRRALTIIKNKPRLTAKAFAKLMWPESPGWKRHAKCGPNGSHRGGGMYTAAGCFLGRLQCAGLVRRTRDLPPETIITPAGRVALTKAGGPDA